MVGHKEIVIEHVEKESVRVEHSKEKALRTSIYEGSAAAVADGVGSSYITPFALALNAGNFQIGTLSAFSGLFSPLAQFFGSKLMERHSRKRIVMTFVLVQAFMWLTIAVLAVLFWKDIFSLYLPYALIILYSILIALWGFAYPSWFSWMGDLVPENERGKYFSKRNRITGAVGLAVFLAAGFLLDLLKTKGLVLIGFASLFTIAFAFRFTSYNFFRRQYCPQFRLKKGYYFSIFDFLKRFDNFGKFAVFQFALNLAIMIASPFFTVYMLKNLGFSYLTYTIIAVSSAVVYLIFVPVAGKFSDKYGNRKLLFFGGIFYALTPALFPLFSTPILIILIPFFISGLATAAFTIAANNFTYDAVSQQHRGLCVAYTNILAGAGVFIGSLIGGFLATTGIGIGVPIISVFIVSAVLRFLVVLLFMPHIKEVKKVKRIPHFSLNLTHPFKMIHADMGWFKNFVKG